jgi:ATP-dependent DNA ligase
MRGSEGRGCANPVRGRRPRYVEHIDARGTDFYGIACERNLEGIVGKWKHGTYAANPLKTSWVKIKNPDYSQAVDRHELFEKRRLKGGGGAKGQRPELVLT